MPNVGPMELMVVLVIALIVLGPKRLPDVGRSVGRGMREFKRSVTGEDQQPDLPAGPPKAALHELDAVGPRSLDDEQGSPAA